MVEKRCLVFALLLIFSVSFVLAGFEIDELNPYSIKALYGQNTNIEGWVKIQLNEEPSGSLFSDSFDNNISLEKVLESNSQYEYTCSTPECSDKYVSSNAQNTKTFSQEGDVFIGLKLTGDVEDVDSVSFDISSNSGASCGDSQLIIDILDDGAIEIMNNQSTGSLCLSTKNYGCFNTDLPSEEWIINDDKNAYCEKINLSSAPSVSAGAWIKNQSGVGSIGVELFNSEWSSEGFCNLATSSSSGEEVSCSIDAFIEQPGEYYACVFSDSSNNSYRIQGYSSGDDEYCGYYGVENPVSANYRIFVVEEEFAPFGSQTISNNFEGNVLSQIVEDYIKERYGSGMECGTEGCIVPIKASSSVSQSFSFSNLDLTYTRKTGSPIDNNFWDISKTSPEISSVSQRLYLDSSGFKVPNETGDYDYSLSLNGEEIISNENISIKDAPIINSLTPLMTAAPVPTTFKVEASEASENITSYEWDFGDDSNNIITEENTVSHVYSSVGSYNLTLKVEDSRGISSSKTFSIDVGLPDTFINTELNRLNFTIGKLEEDISQLTPFQKQGIKTILDLDGVKSQINILREQYESVENDSEYIEIASSLIELGLPNQIIQTKSSSDFIFFPKTSNVNLNAIESAHGSSVSVSNEEAYRDAVVAWQQNNLITSMGFTGFSSETNGDVEHLVDFFEIEVSEKTAVSYPYYFIIQNLENLQLQGSSGDAGNYKYQDLRENQRVSFYTTENVEFTNLPAFISPSLSRLNVNEDLIGEHEEPQTTLWTVIALIILLIVAGFAYIFMKEWYKRKYEGTLFKDRNDLYNMVNYVNNAKKKGLNDTEIRKNLKKAGWNNERIRYVMKKYGGKNTGILEIPVDKLVDKFGKKK